MKFNPRARLDTSQIEDRRGQRGGEGWAGSSGLPTGGGIVGVIVVVIIYFLSQSGGGTGGSGQQADIHSCRSGADTSRLDWGLAAEVDGVWCTVLDGRTATADGPSVHDRPYGAVRRIDIPVGAVPASSAMGPFSAQWRTRRSGSDTSFFHDMLQQQLGARGGDFADAYVLAHEYGHHVQDLLGTMSAGVPTRAGPTSDSVRLELQAELRGRHLGALGRDEARGPAPGRNRSSPRAHGQPTSGTRSTPRPRSVTTGYQQRTEGHIVQDQWTHQLRRGRISWFTTGYRAGQVTGYDTFSTPTPL